ncbi:MAG: phosphatase PAP2 family protein [Paludibacteraceae bacterium]|nr:phosphatase PAP2 family protein [Paludibacteraceae bacterium]
MFQTLLQWDQSLLLAINGCNSPFFDHFFNIITKQTTWIPLLVLLLWRIYRKLGKLTWWYVAFMAVVILCADQISSDLIKPLVARPRPTHTPGLENLVHVVNGYRGGAFGFVSSHAANSFGLALFLTLMHRQTLLSIVSFLWAALFSYSRMYLGVHYPGDILCGAIVGMLVAWATYATLRKAQPYLLEQCRQLDKSDAGYFTELWLITIVVAAFV